MKRRTVICAIFGLVVAVFAVAQAEAGYHVTFDFETGWAGDYAPGWENSAYRHGEAPVGKMMQQVSTSHSGIVRHIGGSPSSRARSGIASGLSRTSTPPV